MRLYEENDLCNLFAIHLTIDRPAWLCKTIYRKFKYSRFTKTDQHLVFRHKKKYSFVPLCLEFLNGFYVCFKTKPLRVYTH